MSADPIRDAADALVAADGDGWHVRDYVIALGIERLAADGTIQTTPYYYAPPDQPDYVTDGLLMATCDTRAIVDGTP